MTSVYKIPQKIKCLSDKRKRKSIPLFNIVMPVLLFLMLQYESFHTVFSAPECGLYDGWKSTACDPGPGNAEAKGWVRKR